MAQSQSQNKKAGVKRADLDEILGEDVSFPRPINFDSRTSVDPENEERIVIFTLNGKDYSIPKSPRMNLGLKFSRDRRMYGSDIAIVELLTSMLGEDGFNALVSYDGLTPEDLETVAEICSRAAMGKLEAQRPK